MGDSAERIEQRARKKRSLIERLEEHPELRERFEMILDIVDNVDGDVEKADEAERRAIEALRQLGNEVVQDWAQRQHRKKETEYNDTRGVDRKEKKPSTGSQSSEKSK
jgi:hypothetical protein